MVMRGEQLIIPQELQAMVVQLAHEGHIGYDKTINTLVPRDGGDGQGVRGDMCSMPGVRSKDQSGASIYQRGHDSTFMLTSRGPYTVFHFHSQKPAMCGLAQLHPLFP
jgi:hypothetical protein